MSNKDGFDIHYPLALLFGGQGHERDISLRSGATLATILERLKIPTLLLAISPSGGFYLYTGSSSDIDKISWDGKNLYPTYPIRLGDCSGFLLGKRIISVGCVIPALHGDFGEDGRIAGALSTAGIRFVGADVLGGAIAQDKAIAKLIADSEGIPTVPFVLYQGGSESTPCGVRHAYTEDSAVGLCERRLGYPMFVKPSGLGSSVGCAVATTRNELLQALRQARSLDRRVIIERRIDIALELEVAYLGGEDEIFTCPASVETSGFYDYGKKYSGDGGVKINPTAAVDDSVKRQAIEYSRRLVRLLDMRSIARVDFLLSTDGVLYFNEINSFPGFTDGSMYREMLRLAGVDDGEFIARLTRSGDAS